ncbi:MAG TPA: TlpA disulfide reductase family protein [Streptosporangiaceae bacterium]
MSRLRPCPPGRSRPAVIRPWLTSPRRAAAAASLAAAALALTACSSGPIAQSTPASNGQNFVPGAPGTTVFGHDSPMAPRVSGTTLGGARLSLSEFRGHVLVLNFWGSWCTPCRAEAPALAALAQHFGPAGVRFLGVDIRDTPATAEAYQRDFRITYPSLNDPGDEIALDFASTVPPAGIPTTLVISRTGRIAARIIGGVSYPGLRGLITTTLAQRS